MPCEAPFAELLPPGALSESVVPELSLAAVPGRRFAAAAAAREATVCTWEVDAFFPKNDFPLPDLVDIPLDRGFLLLEGAALASLFDALSETGLDDRVVEGARDTPACGLAATPVEDGPA